VRYADAFSARLKEMIDGWIARTGIDAPAAEEDPAEFPLGPLSWPRHLDLHDAGIGTVIWATGFGGDYGWLTMPVRRPDGMPYQRGGVTPAAGLYTVGVPWQSRRSSAILLGIGRDADAVAARIAQRDQRARGIAV
jgi:putative flavoprotein involved in K+ transport